MIKGFASLVVLLGALVLSAHSNAQEVSADEAADRFTQESAWSLATASSLLARFQIDSPSLRQIPQDKDAFRDFLKALDEFSDLYREKNADSSSGGFGVYLIRVSGSRLLIPLRDGPAWQQGLTAPMWLSPDSHPENGEFVGWRADTQRYVSRQLRPGVLSTGLTEVRTLNNLHVLSIYQFEPRRTVKSATQVLSRLDEPVVLDLRYCAGGDPYEATDFSSLWFSEKRQWLSLVDRSNKQIRLSSGPSLSPTIAAPRVVLVSQFTASACEQLVAGLAFYNKIVTVGQTTHGKCSVQTTYGLEDNHRLRFTTGYWLGPMQTPCADDGISPDHVVSQNIHRDESLLDVLDGLIDTAGE